MENEEILEEVKEEELQGQTTFEELDVRECEFVEDGEEVEATKDVTNEGE